MSEKIFRDPVHDVIAFRQDRETDALLFRLLNAIEIQRLRRIRQLGFISPKKLPLPLARRLAVQGRLAWTPPEHPVYKTLLGQRLTTEEFTDLDDVSPPAVRGGIDRGRP